MNELSGKNVYENLLKEGIIKPKPPAEEKAILKIWSLNISEDIAGDFRYLSRMLRDKRNMPFAFWGNSSGGVHCGFFFERPRTFEDIEKYLDSEEAEELKDLDTNENLVPILKKLLEQIREMDPTESYDMYWFA